MKHCIYEQKGFCKECVITFCVGCKGVIPKLNEKQKFFAELYASDREFFGNGVQAYIEAYDPEREGNWYKSAAASASRLLNNVNVLEHINNIFEGRGLNDVFVDKQLEFLITQHDDKKSKLGAIKEYNAIRERIKHRLDLTSKGEKIDMPLGFHEEDLAKARAIKEGIRENIHKRADKKA